MNSIDDLQVKLHLQVRLRVPSHSPRVATETEPGGLYDLVVVHHVLVRVFRRTGKGDQSR